MPIAKLRRWEIMLIKMVAIPILKRILPMLKEKAAETPAMFDDAIVGALEVIIEFLGTADIWEET